MLLACKKSIRGLNGASVTQKRGSHGRGAFLENSKVRQVRSKNDD